MQWRALPVTGWRVGVGVGALVSATLGTSLVGSEQRWLVNLAWTVAAALATYDSWRASLAVETDRDRLCWRLLTAAAGLWLAGALLLDVLNATGASEGVSPGPGVLWQLAGVTALLALAKGSPPGGFLYRLFLLDALPVVCLAIAVVQIANGDPLRLSWSQEYLFGFAAVYALLGLVALQLLARSRHSASLLVLLSSLTVTTVAALIWAVQALELGRPHGTVADVIWTAAFVGLALGAALRQTAGRETITIVEDHERALRTVPPALAVLGLVALQARASARYDEFILALASIAVAAVVLRFYIARTEVARQARELADANERLREVDTLKDELIALVSHELRTPLTSVRGYVQMVRDGDAGLVTEQQAEFLDVALRNAVRLERLVGDLLFVAQVEAGRLRLDLAPAELGRLVDEAAQTIGPAADAKDLAVEVDAPEPVVARVDPVRFGQLIDNLLSNAVKFTPPGGSVRVSLHEQDGSAVLVVADTGVGIPEDEQAELFDRFYRTRSATQGAVPGTGLGLAITRAIAEAHGATISLESEAGRGTRVTVAFGDRRPA